MYHGVRAYSMPGFRHEAAPVLEQQRVWVRTE